MAQPDPNRVLRVPGKFSINPTDLDLTGAYPHGGTALGLKKIAKFIPNVQYHLVITESLGVQPTEGYLVGEAHVIGTVLREFELDAITTIFHNTSVGAVSGEPIIESPGSFEPGNLLSTRSVVLVFTPEDREHPGLIMRRALPMVDEAAEMNLAKNEPMEFSTIWTGIPDVNGKVTETGLLEDIVL